MFLPVTQPRFLSHPAHNLVTVATAVTGLQFYNTTQPHQFRHSNSNIFIAFGGKSSHMSSTLRVGNCGGRLDSKEKRRNSETGRGSVDSIKVRNSNCFWHQSSAQSCYQHAEEMRLLIVSKMVHSLKYGD
jgi:hypothetical protein